MQERKISTNATEAHRKKLLNIPCESVLFPWSNPELQAAEKPFGTINAQFPETYFFQVPAVGFYCAANDEAIEIIN